MQIIGPELVEKIIQRDFPDFEWNRIRLLLEEYGTKEQRQPEKYRVRLCILKLADKNSQAIEQLVRLACEDYRDVIILAAYMETTKLSDEKGLSFTEAELENAEKKDLKQFESWLYAK